MKSKPNILYRPLPTGNEIMKGYLLRVAYENGYASIRSLSNVIGHHIGPIFYREHFSEHRKITNILRHHLCLTPAQFRLCDLRNTKLVQNKCSIVNITDRRVKVCIECLKDSPMLHKKWEAVHATHCLEHQCEISHSCPNCHQLFTDDTLLFDCCPRCELPWENICMVRSRIPMYQQVDESLSGEQQIAFRSAFFQMLVFVTRPLDLHLAVYQHFPKFIMEGDMLKYFDFAFSMLANENFARAMLDRRRAYCCQHGELKHLQASLSYFDEAILKSINIAAQFIRYKKFDILEFPDALDNSKHYKNTNNISDYNYPFKIDHQSTAELLGINAMDLNQLVGESIVQGCEFVGVRKRNWFDIRTVEMNLKSISTHVQYCDVDDKKWINLYDMSSSLKRTNLSFAKALKLIITHGLKLITANKNWRLIDLKVCRKDAIALFEAQFIESLSGPIQKKDILNYFQFNGKQFDAFKSLFQNELIFEKCKFGYIPGEAIKRFFDDFILLNKKCQLKKVNLKNCVSELRVVGRLPENIEAAKSHVYIYKKSPSIQADINEITHRLARK